MRATRACCSQSKLPRNHAAPKSCCPESPMPRGNFAPTARLPHKHAASNARYHASPLLRTYAASKTTLSRDHAAQTQRCQATALLREHVALQAHGSVITLPRQHAAPQARSPERTVIQKRVVTRARALPLGHATPKAPGDPATRARRSASVLPRTHAAPGAGNAAPTITMPREPALRKHAALNARASRARCNASTLPREHAATRERSSENILLHGHAAPRARCHRSTLPSSSRRRRGNALFRWSHRDRVPTKASRCIASLPTDQTAPPPTAFPQIAPPRPHHHDRITITASPPIAPKNDSVTNDRVAIDRVTTERVSSYRSRRPKQLRQHPDRVLSTAVPRARHYDSVATDSDPITSDGVTPDCWIFDRIPSACMCTSAS